MFWERYESLCREAGVSPSGMEMRNTIGVSTGAIPNWKKGAVPEHKRLEAIATYFHTTISYLLGDSDDRHPPAPPENEKTPAEAGAESALDADIMRAIAGQSDEVKRKVLALLLELQPNAKP